MKKIDITERVISTRTDNKKREQKTLAAMTMPKWMQTPFDEYFDKNSASDSPTSNVVKVDFSQPALDIPKALAASSAAKQRESWYDQGIIAFKDANGAILNIIFNKASDTNTIDITVTVTDGESEFLKPYCGLSKLHCSLFDKQTELATLIASVNHNGSFMLAEGTVSHDYEPEDGDDFISLRFHN